MKLCYLDLTMEMKERVQETIDVQLNWCVVKFSIKKEKEKQG